jgi:hypothetical protein
MGMPVSSVVSKLTYLAKEAVVGTRQPPNKFLAGLNIRVVGNNTRGEVRPSGSLLRTSRPSIQNWSAFTIAAGSYLDYNSTLYPMAGLLGVPTTTTPGGGTLSREHAITFAPDGSNVRPAFTFGTGYTGGLAEETIRNVFQSFNFGFSRTAAPSIGGGGYGRALDLSAALGVNELVTITPSGTWSGGTYTLSFGGQTTAGIAVAASPATAKTAFELLSTVGAGNSSFGGAALNAGAMTITFVGTKANTDVGAVTISTASVTGGGTATVVVTQQGGITTVPVKAMQAPEWDIYIDSTAGGIGTTAYKMYSGAFTFNGLTNPDWVISSALTSYDDDVLQVPELTLNLVGRNDAANRSLYTSLLGGSTQYVRFQATGPLIEAALPYLFRVDCAVQASENIGQMGDQGGSETMAFPLTIISDSTLASGGFSCLIRNILTSL